MNGEVRAAIARLASADSGDAALIREWLAQPCYQLPAADQLLIVTAVASAANRARTTARNQVYASLVPQSVLTAAQREAAECDRVAQLLCDAWGLQWQRGLIVTPAGLEPEELADYYGSTERQ